MTQSRRILGIDPALRSAGWGIIDQTGGKLQFVASGLMKPDPKSSLAERLSELHQLILTVIEQWQPDEAAVEETFVNTSPQDALKLGQARGVCLMTPANCGLQVAEYAANTIKKAVVGAGHADKSQVEAMVRILLPKAGKQKGDAADALAVAICHAHHQPPANMRASA